MASAKGGVGKTTTSINLGTALAARDLDVVVVELDLAMANVVDFLTLPFDEEADPSMHDVLAGDVPVADAVYDAPGGASVAPSGTSLDALGSVDVSRLPEVVEELSNWFDVVVLDTGAGVNSATTTAMAAADETILVSTPRVASVRDTEKTRQIVERNGGRVRGVVITHGGTGSSPGSARLSEFLEVELLCTVPQDATIQESQDVGTPVVERRPDSEAALAYAEAADALVESVTGEGAEDEISGGESADDPSAGEQSAGEPAAADRRDSPSGSTPSKEALEAEGWTFPGAGDADVGAAAASQPEGAVAADGESTAERATAGEPKSAEPESAEPNSSEPATGGPVDDRPTPDRPDSPDPMSDDPLPADSTLDDPGDDGPAPDDDGPAVGDYDPAEEIVRAISADGGDPDSAVDDGPAVPGIERMPEPPQPSEPPERPTTDRPQPEESEPVPDEDESVPDADGDADEADGESDASDSLAGRVSSLLRRR